MDRTLRQRAEIVLHQSCDIVGQTGASPPPVANQALEDLHLHQIELEMQNEDLRRSQDALQAAEGRYFDFYDLAPVGYCTVSDSGQILQANLSTAGMLGMSRGALEQQKIRRFIFADDQDAYHLMCQRLKESNVQQACELRMVRLGGEPLWVQLLALSVPQDNASPVLRMVLTDISMRKQNEVVLEQYRHHLEDMVDLRTSEIAQAKHAAAAASLAKSVFLANMSHEMRNPLNVVQEGAKRLREDPEVFEKQRQNIDLIHRNSGQLLTFINELLDLAKIDAGQMETENSTFDLEKMLHEVTDLMRLPAQERGLDLRLDPASIFPPFVNGDAGKLRQTLINLINNAIQLNEHGQITVRVIDKSDKAMPQQFSLEVEDNGAGIHLTNHENIFEPFIQLGPKESIGSGLGLAISQRYVQLMGGRISVQSAPGKGTLYRVELPHDAQLEPRKFVYKSDNGQVIGLAPDQRAQRILIVEPQIENAKLLAEILDFPNLHVRVASNGEQSVTMFSEWQPHLILMNVRMPVMDGIEATQKIRSLANGRAVKIVAVAACAYQEKHDTLTAAGLDGVVCKPYQFDEIYGALKMHLGIRFLYDNTGAG
jgi:PAS domain S-box-containing protein